MDEAPEDAMPQGGDEPALTLHVGTLIVDPDPDEEDSFFFRLDTEVGPWDLNLDDADPEPRIFDWAGRRVKVLSGIMALAMEGEKGEPTGERIMQVLRIELDEETTE